VGGVGEGNALEGGERGANTVKKTLTFEKGGGA